MSVETAVAAATEPTAQVTYWLNQIEGAQKWRENFYTDGKAILERYMNEEARGKSADSSFAAKMNVLWSNVQTITPALYSKTPNPKISRRYRDKDPVGKWAAITLERSNAYHLDAYDLDYSIRACVNDYLLPGIGQVWISYEPTFAGSGTSETIKWEYCKTKHLNWQDFLTNPYRTWDEVWWVAQRVWMSREEVAKNPKIKASADKLSYQDGWGNDGQSSSNSTGRDERVKKAPIWEIWSKVTGQVIYVSKYCPELLAPAASVPINFDNFFPCPRPLTATTTNESGLPRPDFTFYQDQANEIDKLTQRIKLLTDALRVVGLYDGSQESLGALLGPTANKFDNEMVPCANWAVFGDRGGIKGSVDFFPIDMIVTALQECYAAREQAKQTMYEITGISDIVRGASKPSETATAQQIKSQWGGLRIRDRQAEVQRFVRDITRLQSEVMAEHFQLETLKTMSNCPLLMQAEKQKLQQRQQFAQQAQQLMQSDPAQAQAIAQANPQLAQMAQPLSLDEMQQLQEPTWEEVYQLLRDERLRCFRIDIETDSTIQADEMEEKAARIEYVTAVTTFVTAWGPIVQANPKMAPLAGALLTFATRAFKRAEQLETEIEATVDMMSQQALMPPQAQPQPPPDPKIEADKQRLQFEQQKHNDEMQLRQKELETNANTELQGRQIDAQKEVAVAQAQQPRSPSSTEMIPALAPLYENVNQMLAAIAQGNQAIQVAVTQAVQASAAVQSQMAQTVETSQQRLEQAINNLMALAAAPKHITVERDQGGRIQSATARPQRTH